MGLPAFRGPFFLSHAIFSSRTSCSTFPSVLFLSPRFFQQPAPSWPKRCSGRRAGAVQCRCKCIFLSDAGLLLLPGAHFSSFSLRCTVPAQLHLSFPLSVISSRLSQIRLGPHHLGSHRITNLSFLAPTKL